MSGNRQIRVRTGTSGTVVATLLEEVREGILKGWNRLRMPDGSERYMSARWCVCGDSDWRRFLKEHWDDKHDYLRTDCLEEFMKVFVRAAGNYIKDKEKDYGQEERNDRDRKEGRNDGGHAKPSGRDVGGRSR